LRYFATRKQGDFMGARLQVLTVNQELHTEECCNCHMLFAMPEEFRQLCLQRGDGFYCPAGHRMVYRDNENARLKKQIAELQGRVQIEATAREWELKKRVKVERERNKIERAKKMLQERIEAGVCPECHRSFANVRNHIKSKHKGSQAAAEVVKEFKKSGVTQKG
jgi:hypothetical protein